MNIHPLAGIYILLEEIADEHGFTMKQVRAAARDVRLEAEKLGEQDGLGTDEGGEEGDVRDASGWDAPRESD